MRGGRRGGLLDRPRINDEVSDLESQDQNQAVASMSESQRNQRPSKKESRNPRAQVAKTRYVKKSALSSVPAEVVSLSNKAESITFGEEVKVLGAKEVEIGETHPGVSLTKSAVSEEKIEVPESSGAEEDVFSRLEKLWKRVVEPDLSEEQLRINDQLQEDELLATESIYGNNVYVLDRQRGLRSFQIYINVDTPGEIAVTAILNSQNNLEGECNSSNDFSYSFKVKYLPPIVLTCLLPKSYPSHLPPLFTISAQWLDPHRISDLCSKLDSISTENLGQEVIYHWVEWLYSSSLPFLDFDREIKLGPYGLRHSGDLRAISGSISPDIDVPALRSYNNERLLQKFWDEQHECSICFSEYAGTEFFRLPCQHFFCSQCLQTYSKMHVREGTVVKLQCPEAKCLGGIPPGLLKRLLGDEEFERWESIMLTKTLESMSDIVYCPRCETPCIEDGGQHALCSKCFFSFCTLCRERRHVGIECMTPEMKLLLLEKRQNSTQLNADQRRKELDMINEILSVKEVLRHAKQCPFCKMAISRTEGCNKMVCSNCGHYFCYRCNKEVDGYDHFRDGSCELFPREVIEAWEERINQRQVIGQIQAQLFADHRHLCPNCGQPNAKVGNNNHIFCWACQNHHCFLCKKIVKRGSHHYGPKGCKQHTES